MQLPDPNGVSCQESANKRDTGWTREAACILTCDEAGHASRLSVKSVFELRGVNVTSRPV